MAQDILLAKSTLLTPHQDQSGCSINICCPNWFDKRESHAVKSAPTFAASLTFPGDDLNFAARVLYAEATGSKVGIKPDELASEKQAILHVMYFRLNRKGYPNNNYIAKSFRMVGEAPKVQFESVAKAKHKFTSTAIPTVDQLNPAECADMQACLDAVHIFINHGPDFKKHPYDEFRDTKSRPNWAPIANNAFHLTKLGAALLAEM